jgi:hypothetical protein
MRFEWPEKGLCSGYCIGDSHWQYRCRKGHWHRSWVIAVLHNLRATSNPLGPQT